MCQPEKKKNFSFGFFWGKTSQPILLWPTHTYLGKLTVDPSILAELARRWQQRAKPYLIHQKPSDCSHTHIVHRLTHTENLYALRMMSVTESGEWPKTVFKGIRVALHHLYLVQKWTVQWRRRRRRDEST